MAPLARKPRCVRIESGWIDIFVRQPVERGVRRRSRRAPAKSRALSCVRRQSRRPPFRRPLSQFLQRPGSGAQRSGRFERHRRHRGGEGGFAICPGPSRGFSDPSKAARLRWPTCNGRRGLERALHQRGLSLGPRGRTWAVIVDGGHSMWWSSMVHRADRRRRGSPAGRGPIPRHPPPAGGQA